MSDTEYLEQQLALMQQRLDAEQIDNLSSKSNMAKGSYFAEQGEPNLIQYQLELREELERIEHLLRGDILVIDKFGTHYERQPDERLRPFNEYGVQLIMNLILFYINKNTILSNYDENTINNKVFDFGEALADLILMKYDEIGMDTPDKKKLYQSIVLALTDSVHSTYLRALNGGERQSLREARFVTQTQPIGMSTPMPKQQKSFSLFKPSTWAK